jgi:hypothetical protein
MHAMKSFQRDQGNPAPSFAAKGTSLKITNLSFKS